MSLILALQAISNALRTQWMWLRLVLVGAANPVMTTRRQLVINLIHRIQKWNRATVCSVAICSEETMAKYQIATAEDEELSVVRCYIKSSWPVEKRSCASRVLSYWGLPNSLSEYNGVVFYGKRLVIPVALRDDVSKSSRSAHQGVTKMLQRTEESVFWPGLRSRIEERCISCEACRSAEGRGRKEPLIPVEVPQYPFQVIGIDFFHHGGTDYLLVADYLLKWPLVHGMISTSSQSVIWKLKDSSMLFGIPEKVVSDNGPQFSSREYREFCRQLGIRQVMSSPLHPTGNGRAERTTGTRKQIMTKRGS